MKHRVNAFVVLAGFASATHTAFAFSVGIGGEPPAMPHDFFSFVVWLYWFLPGLAAAAAIDAGLIALSIRLQNKRPRDAFIGLAVISALSQFFYAAKHTNPTGLIALLSDLFLGAAAIVFAFSLPITLMLWAWAETPEPTREEATAKIVKRRERHIMSDRPQKALAPADIEIVEAAPIRQTTLEEFITNEQ